MSPAGTRPRVRFAYLVCVGVFLWAVAQFYAPATGFTSLIKIGDEISGRETTALRQLPHYVYDNSAGYDGAYYVQLALNPSLSNPELTTAIDNLPYRARRILFCWVAWLAGLGQPGWIVQAHALLNVAVWLALAVVLLRWFPATSWENFVRWLAVMFSHGLCMSVRDSLVDGPALLLVALALAAEEEGKRVRGAALLAFAGLGRETSLLAVTGLAPDEPLKRQRPWWLFVGRAALVALPLLAWIGYIRWKFGPANDPGLGNFTLPLTGLVEKWRMTVEEIMRRSNSPLRWATLGVTIGLTVQFLFFVLRWRPRDRWWRVGATFAVLMMFLATPVWEGLPGAAARALLPMTLAFNILVPRGRAWLAVLLVGNLTMVAAYHEFDPPVRDFFQISGEAGVTVKAKSEPGVGWYDPENTASAHWRWSAGGGSLQVRNDSGRPLSLIIHGRAAAAQDERRLRICAGQAMGWAGPLTAAPADFRFGFIAPPGETKLSFATDLPGHPIGKDERQMAFQILNLEIVAKPVPGQ